MQPKDKEYREWQISKFFFSISNGIEINGGGTN
jgi:hypothetical protein